jgi:hypothetical protein
VKLPFASDVVPFEDFTERVTLAFSKGEFVSESTTFPFIISCCAGTEKFKIKKRMIKIFIANSSENKKAV